VYEDDYESANDYGDYGEADLNEWRVEAVRKYPAVAHFGDLLIGPNREAVLTVAEDLNRRIAESAPKPSPTKPKPKETMAPPEPNPDDVIRQYQEAVASRRTGGRVKPAPSPDDFLAALWAKQAPQREAEMREDAEKSDDSAWAKFLDDAWQKQHGGAGNE
jgi:hypothetical protein